MTRTFARLVAHRMGTYDAAVEVAPGANAAVARRLREAGHRGPLTFIDWRRDALEEHRRSLADNANARWLCSGFYELREPIAGWLLVHRTLPRWRGLEGVVKPRGPELAHEMLRAFLRTGARGAFVLALDVEADVVRLGARSTAVAFEEIEDVLWEDDSGSGAGDFFCLDLEGARRGLRSP